MCISKVILVGLVYWIALQFSGVVVRYFLGKITPPTSRLTDKVGILIGKCENIIAISCILANELTGLSLIFAAKALVRNTADSQKDDYYLCGTLVNLVWSLCMGFIARWIWNYC